MVARPRAAPIPRPRMAFGPTRLNLGISTAVASSMSTTGSQDSGLENVTRDLTNRGAGSSREQQGVGKRERELTLVHWPVDLEQ